MLVVITRDPRIMNWTKSAESNAEAWKPVKQLAANDQKAANEQLKTLLTLVKGNEPLNISGHGNAKEVGDEGSEPPDWTWTVDDLAGLLAGLVPGYSGPILMRVCAKDPANFGAGLAVALTRLRKLPGVWIYSYIKAVEILKRYPDPATLDKNVELSKTQVGH